MQPPLNLLSQHKYMTKLKGKVEEQTVPDNFSRILVFRTVCITALQQQQQDLMNYQLHSFYKLFLAMKTYHDLAQQIKK